MAKQQPFAAPATPTDVIGSRELDILHWRSGLKAAASILRGAIRYARLGSIPKSAMAYYSGVSDVGGTAWNNEQSAHLREVEASLLKGLASESSSDASARLLLSLKEVQANIRDFRT